MRKPLIATACLIASCLVGCGEESTAKQYGDKLDALIAQLGQLEYAAAPTADNKLIYTTGTKIDGIEVPGAYSADASYIDQAITLLPKAKEIAANGSDLQKQSANAIIASILADEGAYLITSADLGYQQGVIEVMDLRGRIGMIKEIIAFNDSLAGDRAVTIDTLRTGNLGNGQSVGGVNEFEEQVRAASAKAEQARQELAAINEKIESLQAKAAEYEALDLQLTNEASSADNETRFEKLDKAVTAEYEAATAEAEANTLGIDAAIKQGQITLADNRKTLVQSSVEELQAKIAQHEAERELIAGKLAELDDTRKQAVASLNERFNQLDAEIQVVGFNRMADAQKKLKEANEALNQARLGGSADLEQMSLYVLQARALHQQSLAASSYAATLTSLAAPGPDVVGSGLHKALTDRVADMQNMMKTTAQEVDALNAEASGMLPQLSSAADPETPEGKIVVEQLRLYKSLLGEVSAPAGGAGNTPAPTPPAGVEDSDAPDAEAEDADTPDA